MCSLRGWIRRPKWQVHSTCIKLHRNVLRILKFRLRPRRRPQCGRLTLWPDSESAEEELRTIHSVLAPRPSTKLGAYVYRPIVTEQFDVSVIMGLTSKASFTPDAAPQRNVRTARRRKQSTSGAIVTWQRSHRVRRNGMRR